jgi:hypothetical protein
MYGEANGSEGDGTTLVGGGVISVTLTDRAAR